MPASKTYRFTAWLCGGQGVPPLGILLGGASYRGPLTVLRVVLRHCFLYCEITWLLDIGTSFGAR
jgi:hypothetical protein